MIFFTKTKFYLHFSFDLRASIRSCPIVRVMESSVLSFLWLYLCRRLESFSRLWCLGHVCVCTKWFRPSPLNARNIASLWSVCSLRLARCCKSIGPKPTSILGSSIASSLSLVYSEEPTLSNSSDLLNKYVISLCNFYCILFTRRNLLPMELLSSNLTAQLSTIKSPIAVWPFFVAVCLISRTRGYQSRCLNQQCCSMHHND